MPCARKTDWQVSVDLSVYVRPTHPVGVGSSVAPDVVGGGPVVTYSVVVAGGITANPDLLHCLVTDIDY
jgi:hypothetical protein